MTANDRNSAKRQRFNVMKHGTWNLEQVTRCYVFYVSCFMIYLAFASEFCKIWI